MQRAIGANATVQNFGLARGSEKSVIVSRAIENSFAARKLNGITGSGCDDQQLLYAMNYILSLLFLMAALSVKGQNHKRVDNSIPLNIKLGESIVGNSNFKHVKDAGKEGLLTTLVPVDFYDAYFLDSPGIDSLFGCALEEILVTVSPRKTIVSINFILLADTGIVDRIMEKIGPYSRTMGMGIGETRMNSIYSWSKIDDSCYLLQNYFLRSSRYFKEKLSGDKFIAMFSVNNCQPLPIITE